MAKKKTAAEALPVSRLPEANHTHVEERYKTGQTYSRTTPRAAHAEWIPPPGRDPLALLVAYNVGRTPSHVPMRHARMAASSFAFYRGAPAVMAYDLAHTP